MTKMKKIILYKETDPAAMPVKPKIAATIASIKKVDVNLSIQCFLDSKWIFMKYIFLVQNTYFFFQT